jgi:ribonuclease R
LTDRDIADLESTAEAISRAGAAPWPPNETADRLIAFHLAGKIGATFQGRISGIGKFGLFVKLDGTGADGFIPVATLGRDYYQYVEKNHALIGERTGETFRLGDRVEVRLAEALPAAGALRFELLTEGRDSGQRGRGRGRARGMRSMVTRGETHGRKRR